MTARDWLAVLAGTVSLTMILGFVLWEATQPAPTALPSEAAVHG